MCVFYVWVSGGGASVIMRSLSLFKECSFQSGPQTGATLQANMSEQTQTHGKLILTRLYKADFLTVAAVKTG